MSREPRWVKGETDEEKFSSIDKVMDKFSRRLKTHTSLAVMPFPVSHYAPEVPADDVVFRYIFVADGRLLGALIDVAAKSGDNVRFQATLVSGRDTVTRGLMVVWQSSIDLDIEVRKGDMLFVSCLDSEAKGIHIGLLWAPSTKHYDVHQYLLNEIDAIQEELQDEGD